MSLKTTLLKYINELNDVRLLTEPILKRRDSLSGSKTAMGMIELFRMNLIVAGIKRRIREIDKIRRSHIKPDLQGNDLDFFYALEQVRAEFDVILKSLQA